MGVLKIKDLLESLSYLVAIVGGTTTGVIFLRRNLREHDQKMDDIFSGRWTNEGNVGEDLPTHFIDLELIVQDKCVNGVLNTRKLNTETYWSNLSVSGNRQGKKVKLQVFHVRHGKLIKPAEIKITLDQKNLKWQLIQGTSDFFPTEVVLWKNDH